MDSLLKSYRPIIQVVLIMFLFHLPLSMFSSTSIEGNIKKADVYLECLKYDSAEIYYQKAMPELKDIQKWGLYCSTVNKYATTLWQQGKLAEAEEIARANLENCYQYLDTVDSISGDCLLNIGIICYLTDRTGMTTEYFKKAIVVYEKNYGHWHPKIAKAHEWLGTAYESVSDKVNAHHHLTESLRIWKKTRGPDHPDLGNIYRYLGLYCKRYYMHDSAMIYFNMAKVLFDEKYGENNYKSVKCLNNICSIYEEAGCFDTAMVIYGHALDLLDKSDAPSRYATMMTFFNIAEAYQNNGDIYKALQYFQKIFPLYFPSFHDDNILSNPKNIEEYPFYIVKILLLYKAGNLISLSEEDPLNRLNYLRSAYECYDLVDGILDRMEKQINNYDVLLSYTNTYAVVMLEMADNAIQLYKFTGDTIFFSTALNFMEKNRNMASMKLRGGVAEINADVPYGTRQNGVRLQNEYNAIKNLILNSHYAEHTDSLENRLLDKKIELDRFNWKVGLAYPAFKYLNYPDVPFTLSDVQMKLKSNQVLIQYSERCDDYAFTPREIMATAISKNEISHFRMDGEKTHKLIVDYYQLISNKGSKSGIDSTGYLLSELLLGPIAGLLEKKELIIIPSQHISLVPFDALPILLANGGNTRYMIEDHIIWKTFSVRDFLHKNTTPKPSNEYILAMAPGFTKSKKMQIAMLAKRDTSLMDLSGALSECREINRFFNTRLVTGFDATEKEFKALSGNYHVIHLSTHGVPDSSDETMVKLAFSKHDDTEEDGFLNMYEIFNLDLNADLIVLSACKTGVGELNKGVGNLSLAWAFNRAGARSSVISLWDANDYASSVIMPKFYSYLADGITKPQALRKAKLDFISSSDNLTGNPYFWAGFEYYGNDMGIFVRDKKVGVLFWIGVLCLGVVLVLMVGKLKYNWNWF